MGPDALFLPSSLRPKGGPPFGAYHAVIGAAALPASALAGVLWDRVSPATPFWVGAATAGMAAVLLATLVRPARIT